MLNKYKRKAQKQIKQLIRNIATILLVLFVLSMIYYFQNGTFPTLKTPSYTLENIPEYSGKDYVIINNNEPDFKDEDKTTTSFEKYSDLDYLGRCGTAYANIGTDLMPTKEREYIGNIKPSGWRISKYDFIEGEYLYNRCHLIAYSLTAENSNKKNLITCTRHLNADVMNMFELKVLNYIRRTNNHVLYKVTPIFEGNNLLASGVEMQAYSVEDSGKLKFHIYAYNRQDKVEINYKTGQNKLLEE